MSSDQIDGMTLLIFFCGSDLLKDSLALYRELGI